MHTIRFLFLSLLSFIFLSGFLFEERGATPSPHVEIKTDTQSAIVEKETFDDFPIIKIKAFEPTPKQEIVPKVVKSKPVEKPKIIKKVLTKPIEKKESTASRINIQQTQTKQIKKNLSKTNKTLPRRRKSGHARKLIFDKKRSLKDIPLPLPSLSSLKLKSLIKSLPTIPMTKIPIINSILPEGSQTSHRRIKNKQQNIINQNQPFSNDESNLGIVKNLDMANIRIGRSNDYTTLIFDSYQWDGYNTESTIPAAQSGYYEFSYEPKKNRIVAHIKGYSAFSALLGDQSSLFKDNDIIKNIYIDRYIGKDSIQFIIQLKKKVKITILDVKNPGRIIVNLYPQ